MTDLEPLVREAREIDAEIADLTAKKTALVERIKAEMIVGDSLTIDGVRCSLKPGNRSFSVPVALSMMDEAMKMKCIATKIDDKLVREVAEAFGLLEEAMIPADPSKTVFKLTS